MRMRIVRVEIYEARDGWRWRMKRRGRIIAESGQGYSNKRTLKRTLTNLLETEKHEFLIFES